MDISPSLFLTPQYDDDEQFGAHFDADRLLVIAELINQRQIMAILNSNSVRSQFQHSPSVMQRTTSYPHRSRISRLKYKKTTYKMEFNAIFAELVQ